MGFFFYTIEESIVLFYINQNSKKKKYLTIVAGTSSFLFETVSKQNAIKKLY